MKLQEYKEQRSYLIESLLYPRICLINVQHKSTSSRLEMSGIRQGYRLHHAMLLHGLLLLTLSAVFCQAVSPCDVLDTDRDGHLRLWCINITDFSTVNDAIANLVENISILIIGKSPQLIINRDSFNDPRLQNLDGLYFIESNLTNLSKYHLQGLTKLQFWDLGHNSLTSINQESFSGLDHLNKLFLCDNQINDIQIGAFRNLVNLSVLDLSANNITSVTPDAFQGLSKLQLLDLGHNFLTVIDGNMFRGLPNLLKLNVTNNQIRTVDVRAFKTNLNLEQVDFEGNQLEGLDVNLFENTKLKSLYLEYNKLTSLSNFPLNISTLERINICHNNITNIAADYFSNVPKLKTIDLSDNQLEKIPSGLFSATTSRRVIHLERNNLRSIPFSVFTNLEDLFDGSLISETRGVYLGHNPWDCYHSDIVDVRIWCLENYWNCDRVFGCGRKTAL